METLKKNETLLREDLHLTLKFCYYELYEEEEIINHKKISKRSSKIYYTNCSVCLFAWNSFCCTI